MCACVCVREAGTTERFGRIGSTFLALVYYIHVHVYTLSKIGTPSITVHTVLVRTVIREYSVIKIFGLTKEYKNLTRKIFSAHVVSN